MTIARFSQQFDCLGRAVFDPDWNSSNASLLARLVERFDTLDRALMAQSWCATNFYAPVRDHTVTWHVFVSVNRDLAVAWAVFPYNLVYVTATGTTVAGAWSPYNAATLHEAVDEASPDDGDYAVTTAPSTMKLAVGAVQPFVVEYRLRSIGGQTVKVRLLEGETVKHEWTHAAVPAGVTQYQQIVTASVGDPNNLFIEAQAV